MVKTWHIAIKLKNQKDMIAVLKQGDYKNGLYDQLQEVELHIKES